MPSLSAESRETLLRSYAEGDISWRDLQARGFVDYIEVLGGLGELGLRPRIAPMAGPNVDRRLRGRATIAAALREAIAR